MGGIFRALRHELGHPLYYPVDDADYTLITRREAKVLGAVGSFLMLMAQAWYVAAWGVRNRR